ncbi:hypothetical protein [Dongshaea marina]|uniref:hypothetical protein n=1 Tax=Dongshaea marina TaxID=2047966 RepID=UPI0018FF3105|nr:hypothetical protein [Dongshaea marina]
MSTKLKMLPNCYTDLCVHGKWFHYDHGDHTVYMLNGGCPPTFELGTVPQTEEELEQLLEPIALDQLSSRMR